MEQEKIIDSLLELVERPAFCVCDGKIRQVNQAARQKLIAVGMNIYDLLGSDGTVYSSYRGGTQTLTATVSGIPYRVQISRVADKDIFVLESEDPQMRAIALAAQNLRGPLNSVMTIADLLSCEDSQHIGQLRLGSIDLFNLETLDSYLYCFDGEESPIQANTPCTYQINFADFEESPGTLPSGSYRIFLDIYDDFDEADMHPLTRDYRQAQGYWISFDIP